MVYLAGLYCMVKGWRVSRREEGLIYAKGRVTANYIGGCGSSGFVDGSKMENDWLVKGVGDVREREEPS